jgi:hypothetical protein
MKIDYWIYKTVYMCPLCGHAKAFNQRRLGKKPKDPSDRKTLKEVYDYCDV